MQRSILFGTLLASTFVAGPLWAQLTNEELICRPDEPRLDKYGYLRALSLDLRGTLPSAAEYAALDSEPDVPESLIDEMLSSNEFVTRAVRRHRALLWNNITNVNPISVGASLQLKSPERLLWRRTVARTYRGGDVPCADVPATWDSQGNLIFTPAADGTRLEGFVEVQPYWAPTTTVKVCAADAQTLAMSPTGTDCRTTDGFRDPRCGCGPELRHCRYANANWITESFATDIEMRIAKVVREDRPYAEIFTGRTAFVNGPIVHYLKYLADFPNGVRVTPLPYDLDRLPDLRFIDRDTWVEIELPEDHAGVLTSIAYLLRFQTNRARASRFYDSFLCQPLSPPPGGLPPVAPDAIPHPDLQQRDGCKYCHALLEPASAHWGRWTERGAGYLSSNDFPATRADCRTCAMSGQACSRDCRLYYSTIAYSRMEEPYLGALLPYSFLKTEHHRNVELGPKILVAETTVDDRFPSCTARRVLEGYLGRSLTTDEGELLGDMGRHFVTDGFRYQALVKSVVTSPIYRRVR